MRIAFVTCFHGRTWLSQLWHKHTARHGPIFAAASSGDEDTLTWAESQGLNVDIGENQPLGAKHNRALALALKDDRWDAVMILPSDDFVEPIYLEAVRHELRQGADYIAPASCGMVDVATGKACILRHATWTGTLKFGAGRVLSRKAVEHIGELWTPGKARGLDTDSHAHILAHGYTAKVIDLGPDVPCLTDVKTETNIWPYRQWAIRGKPSTVDRALGFVDAEITEAILRRR